MLSQTKYLHRNWLTSTPPWMELQSLASYFQVETPSPWPWLRTPCQQPFQRNHPAEHGGLCKAWVQWRWQSKRELRGWVDWSKLLHRSSRTDSGQTSGCPPRGKRLKLGILSFFLSQKTYWIFKEKETANPSSSLVEGRCSSRCVSSHCWLRQCQSHAGYLAKEVWIKVPRKTQQSDLQ